MEWIALGTGTLTPQAQRASSCYLVEEDGHRLGLDFGRNGLSRMVEAGFDPLDLEELLLTHVHPDHSCELVSLLFARNYARRPGTSGVAPLRLAGPAGVEQLVEDLCVAWPWLRPSEEAPLEILEWEGPDGSPVPAARSFEVVARTLEHGNTIDLGYRVTSPRSGHSVAYTGDTGPCAALVELARDVDLLVCECSWPEAREPAVHLWPEAIGEVAAAAGCRGVLLTHFYPETSPQGAAQRVREVYGGPVEIALDGSRWDVPRLRRAGT